MRAVAEGYVVILQFAVGHSPGVNQEVLHVAGVMAFGIVESVLLVFGIEMRPGRFEVGSLALWVLMEVNGVLARREITKVKLESDPSAVFRQDDSAYRPTIGVFEVDLGLGCAGKGENNQSNSRR